jgi:hypothetical protein
MMARSPAGCCFAEPAVDPFSVRAMTGERPTLRIDGDEKTLVHAGWGRSGKRAVVTIANPNYENPRQVVLTVEQATELGRFLCAGPGAP